MRDGQFSLNACINGEFISVSHLLEMRPGQAFGLILTNDGEEAAAVTLEIDGRTVGTIPLMPFEEKDLQGPDDSRQIFTFRKSDSPRAYIVGGEGIPARVRGLVRATVSARHPAVLSFRIGVAPASVKHLESPEGRLCNLRR